MNIVRNNVKFEITREEAQTLNDFYMAMNFEEPFSDWTPSTVWEFLELIHERETGGAPLEEPFIRYDDVVEIIYKN